MHGSYSESDDFGDTRALQRRVPSRDTEKPCMKTISQFAKWTDPTRKLMIWAPQGGHRALQRRGGLQHTEKPYMKMVIFWSQFPKCTDPTRKVMIFATQGATEAQQQRARFQHAEKTCMKMIGFRVSVCKLHGSY